MLAVVEILFLFFKQKTAYEMRISDWSSDVCSSDLLRLQRIRLGLVGADVDHHVADFAVGLQELRVDVEIAGGEQFVDARQRAGHVAVDVQQAAADRKSVV